MEYLNGGDLYSLLRNLGCLDEDVARVYIAEVASTCDVLRYILLLYDATPRSQIVYLLVGRCLL